MPRRTPRKISRYATPKRAPRRITGRGPGIPAPKKVSSGLKRVSGGISAPKKVSGGSKGGTIKRRETEAIRKANSSRGTIASRGCISNVSRGGVSKKAIAKTPRERISVRRPVKKTKRW